MKSSGWLRDLIYIDNYDEVMNSVEEVRQSLLSGAGGSQDQPVYCKSRRNRKEDRE